MKDFIPAGFFALRTPLLPFDELLSWTEGLQASASLGNPMELERALAQDRALLRARLREIVSRPEIREAIFIASTHLDDAVGIWLREPDSDRGQGIELALLRYFIRMTARATPFGLYAGCSTGLIGDETRLVLAERSKYQRHTCLTFDYLFALTDALRNDAALRKTFVYRPNSSLYRLAGRIRYVVSRLKDKVLSYHLVFAEETDYLISTLARAEQGASFDSLAQGLVSREATLAEAEAYVSELIESQILSADIPLRITGPESIHPLIEWLGKNPLTIQISDTLEQARKELLRIDDDGLGIEARRYHAVSRPLGHLPAEVDPAHLFHVDMIKPVEKATLSNAVIAEITRGVEILLRFQSVVKDDELTKFRSRFVDRYEMREVPLLEALDEEDGVGFDSARDATPLLEGLNLSPGGEEMARWGAREKFLLRKLGETLRGNSPEMVLTREDVEAMAAKNSPPLPEAFAASVSLIAATEEHIASGNFQIVFNGAWGPSGARLLGRFCHADPELRSHVESHLRAEEALHPEASFAEIVHVPAGGRFGFLCRPGLRAYEIPYLGASAVPHSEQIATTDLTVSVHDGRIVLRSRKLGREVIPRMTCAHNYSQSSLGVYKFLCALQNQGLGGDLSWNWGLLREAEFLPRVVIGRLILCRAQWRVAQKELKQFGRHHAAALFQAVQQWRHERDLPRWVAVADADNILPVDFDNILSVEMFVHLLRNREEAVLTEVFPGPDQLCVNGPEGRFVHELIVPFIKTSRKSPTSVSPQPAPLVEGITRTFAPGSEWLYAKLYLGNISADEVLLETIAPLVRKVIASGAAERWFFIRYADPDPHLRLRFHGQPERLRGEVLPAIQRSFSRLMEDGLLRCWQLDTYERELERYGGSEGMIVAERFFQLDSEAVLEMLALLEYGDAGLDERWRLALRGIDSLLTDFGLHVRGKWEFFKEMPQHFAELRHIDHNMRAQLSEKFRRERTSLEQLLDPACDQESPLLPGLRVLSRRSERMAPVVNDMKRSMERGRFFVSIHSFVASCIHMHVNRMLRSAQRTQELVIYDFLSRLYHSRAVREHEDS